MDNNYYIYYELELINKALADIKENYGYMSDEDLEIENQLEKRKDFLEFLLNYA